jgi:hypothetical protein
VFFILQAQVKIRQIFEQRLTFVQYRIGKLVFRGGAGFIFLQRYFFHVFTYIQQIWWGSARVITKTQLFGRTSDIFAFRMSREWLQ